MILLNVLLFFVLQEFVYLKGGNNDNNHEGILRPCLVGSLSTSKPNVFTTVSGNFAYSSLEGCTNPKFENCVDIINISIPQRPQIVAEFVGQPARLGQISVEDEKYVLFQSTQTDLSLMNITDKTNPVLTAKLDFKSISAYVSGVFVPPGWGTTAYVAANSGLFFVEILDPSNPSLLGKFQIEGDGTSFFVYQSIFDRIGMDLAFYITKCASTGGLRILDVRNPIQPSLVGQIDSCDFRSFAVSSTHIFVISNGRKMGMEIYDFSSSLKSPLLVSSVMFRSKCDSILLVDGNRVFIGCEDGLKIYDISDVNNPVMIGTVLDKYYTSLSMLKSRGSQTSYLVVSSQFSDELKIFGCI